MNIQCFPNFGVGRDHGPLPHFKLWRGTVLQCPLSLRRWVQGWTFPIAGAIIQVSPKQSLPEVKHVIFGVGDYFETKSSKWIEFLLCTKQNLPVKYCPSISKIILFLIIAFKTHTNIVKNGLYSFISYNCFLTFNLMLNQMDFIL